MNREHDAESHVAEDAQSALQDVAILQKELIDFAELEVIRQAMADLRLPAAAHLIDFQQRVEQLLARLTALLSRLASRNGGRNHPTDGLALVSLVNELRAQIDWLEGILEQLQSMSHPERAPLPTWFLQSVSGPVRRALDTIRQVLARLLRRLLSKVWQIISGLLTPKEWKLQGKVGTGILGLADVGIEITFGADPPATGTTP